MNFEQYQSIDAVHYSALSSIAKHPSHLAREFSDEEQERELTESMLLGSLTDCIIFTPDEFDTRFFESTTVKPSDKMGLMLEYYLEHEGSPLLMDKDKVLEAARAVNYQRNWGPDTIYKKFVEECAQYINIISTLAGRTLVSPEMKERATKLVTTLVTNEYTGPIFKPQEGVDKLPQFFYKWNVVVTPADDGPDEVLDCKMLSDYVVIDHRNKTIQPYDLKVIYGNPLQFYKTHYVKFNYYLQAAFYTLGLQKLVENVPEFANYRIEPFRFMVIAERYLPVIWTVTDLWLQVGLYGGQLTDGDYIPGVYKLLSDYAWHKYTRIFDYPSEVVLQNGVLRLPNNIIKA